MKTKEEQLKDYKKSNKIRRVKLAVKAGFKTAEDYLKYLSGIPAKKKVKSSKKDMLDYVVAFDTTGSMRSYIGDVKKHVKDLIPEMFSKGIDLKMKIVAFGDYCDMKGDQFGKAYQESEFTDNVTHLQNFILNAENTSGGDVDEFYELVIKKITEETPWRDGSRKSVLFIADEMPHTKNYVFGGKRTGIDWKEEAKKAASLKISFDTLAIHGDKYPWYRELSNITNGVHLPFKSSHKMAQVVADTAYVRGSVASKRSFETSYINTMNSGDEELIGTYKTLATLL